jgi:hypothetical protein
VIDASRAPDAKLPNLDALRADPGGVARAFRAAGLRVTVDPTGRCLAVTAPRHLSDDELLSREDLADPVLVAGIWDRVTREQLASREKGYLRATKLSRAQRAAAERIARRQRMIDAQGRVIARGMEAGHLAIGLWATWQVNVCLHRDGQVICRGLGGLPRPPTQEAIAGPPLSGSVLWYTWPQAAAEWGDRKVSLASGIYSEGDLLQRLSGAGGPGLGSEQAVAGRRLSVVAEQVPLRTLLWAISVAGGLQVRTEPHPGPPRILLNQPRLGEGVYYNDDTNLVLPLPELGYCSAADSTVGSELIAALEGGPMQRDRNSIGWRLSDLPLFYRDSIEEAWQSVNKRSLKPAPPLEPNRTFVLWTKAGYVSVDIQLEDGSGGGSEFLLPAL